MKLNSRRLLAVFLLALISVGFGFAFDATATAVEKHRYPMEPAYAEMISEYALSYGIPEPILWSAVRTRSNFVSNARSESGKTGLMQLSEEEFSFICTEILREEEQDPGLLYDPATNLRCGAAYLSYLYQRYGVWDTVYLAFYAGTDAVNAWLSDSRYVNSVGRLSGVPDSGAAAFAEQMEKAVSYYTKLYF